jgi:hypothetical protein
MFQVKPQWPKIGLIRLLNIAEEHGGDRRKVEETKGGKRRKSEE